jgi:septal ring factor EnvC (AmiA/AmiB activator)
MLNRIAVLEAELGLRDSALDNMARKLTATEAERDQFEAEHDRLKAENAKLKGQLAQSRRRPKMPTDKDRLDWLEKMGNTKEGLLLHSNPEGTGRLGLGLKHTGRTLRQAIDQAMGNRKEKKNDAD